MLLRNYKIGARLLSGFAVLGLLVVLQGSMALFTMSQMRAVSAEIEGNTIPSLNSLSALNLSMLWVRVYTFRMMLAENDDQKAEYQLSMSKVRQDVQESQQQYEALISISGEKETYEQFKAAQQDYFLGQRRLLDVLEKGDNKEANRKSVV